MGEVILYVLNLKLFLVIYNVLNLVTPAQISFLWNHGIYIFFISHLVAETGSHVVNWILKIIIISHHNICLKYCLSMQFNFTQYIVMDCDLLYFPPRYPLFYLHITG